MGKLGVSRLVKFSDFYAPEWLSHETLNLRLFKTSSELRNDKMRVNLVHVYAGCNRVVNAFDWAQGGLVAYAAQNSVVVYDVQVRDPASQTLFL